MKKYTRQRLILDIIQNNEVKTQSQLSKLLRDQGVDATQVDTVYDTLTERMEKIFKESVLSVERSYQLVVIKTISYTATVCGLYITNAKLENIGGIVTGLDTIFITPKNIDEIDDLIETIRSMVK